MLLSPSSSSSSMLLSTHPHYHRCCCLHHPRLYRHIIPSRKKMALCTLLRTTVYALTFRSFLKFFLYFHLRMFETLRLALITRVLTEGFRQLQVNSSDKDAGANHDDGVTDVDLPVKSYIHTSSTHSRSSAHPPPPPPPKKKKKKKKNYSILHFRLRTIIQ